jgi:hypothetical protein
VDQHPLADSYLLRQPIQTKIQRSCADECGEAAFQQLFPGAALLFAGHLVL